MAAVQNQDTLAHRLSDEEYKNWLKAGLCIFRVKEGLESFVTQESDALHKTLLAISNPCGNCVQDVLKNNRKLCTDCEKFKGEIKKRHKFSNPIWDNTNVQNWSQDDWSVAKCFMNSGQSQHASAADADISALLNFIIHCTVFVDQGTYGNIQDNAKTVRDHRNDIFHRGKDKLKKKDLDDWTKDMIELLENENPDGKLKSNAKAKKALTDIKEILVKEFTITLNDENTVRIASLEAQMDEERKLLQKLQNDSTSQGQTIQATIEKIEKIQESLDNVRAHQTMTDEEVSKHISDMEDKFNSVQVDIEQLKTDVENLKSDRKEDKKNIENLKSDRKEDKKDIENLKSDRKEDKKDIENLKSDRKEDKKDIENLKSDRKEDKKDIENLKSDMKEIKKAHETCQNQNRETKTTEKDKVEDTTLVHEERDCNENAGISCEDIALEMPQDMEGKIRIIKCYVDLKLELGEDNVMDIAKELFQKKNHIDVLEDLRQAGTRRRCIDRLLKRVLKLDTSGLKIFFDLLKRKCPEIASKLAEIKVANKDMENFTQVSESVQEVPHRIQNGLKFDQLDVNFFRWHFQDIPEKVDKRADVLLSQFHISIFVHSQMMQYNDPVIKINALLKKIQSCHFDSYSKVQSVLGSKLYQKWQRFKVDGSRQGLENQHIWHYLLERIRIFKEYIIKHFRGLGINFMHARRRSLVLTFETLDNFDVKLLMPEVVKTKVCHMIKILCPEYQDVFKEPVHLTIFLKALSNTDRAVVYFYLETSAEKEGKEEDMAHSVEKEFSCMKLGSHDKHYIMEEINPASLNKWMFNTPQQSQLDEDTRTKLVDLASRKNMSRRKKMKNLLEVVESLGNGYELLEKYCEEHHTFLHNNVFKKENPDGAQQYEFSHEKEEGLQRLSSTWIDFFVDPKDYQHYLYSVCQKGDSRKGKPCLHLYHKDFRRYDCNMCGEEHLKKRKPWQHLRHQKGKNNFRCNLRGEEYSERKDTCEHLHPHKDSSTVQCDICGKVFSTKREMKEHRRHKDIRPYQCNTCDDGYSTQTDLWQHLRVHKDFRCSKCDDFDEEYPKEMERQQHFSAYKDFRPSERVGKRLEAVGYGTPFKKFTLYEIGGFQEILLKTEKRKPCKSCQCKFCRKRFSQYSKPEQDKKNHNDASRYQCDICGKKFSTKKGMKDHKRHHLDTGHYQCDVCGKIFSTKIEMEEHRQNHADFRPYQCDLCSGRFSTKNEMEQHKKHHKDNKAYQCICGKKFTTKRGMERHRQHHSDDKAYQCDICGKKFTTNRGMEQHWQHHFDNKAYQCDICGKKFTTKRGMEQHRQHHFGSIKRQ